MVPEDTWESLRLGVSVEVWDIPRQSEAEALGTEIRPILGYVIPRRAFYLNPNVTVPFSGSDHVPEFEPAAKVLYDTGLGFGVGAEYSGGIGPIDAVPPASNRWVLKRLIGKSFSSLRGDAADAQARGTSRWEQCR